MGKKRGKYLKKKTVFKFLDELDDYTDYKKALYSNFIHGLSKRGRERLDRLYDEWEEKEMAKKAPDEGETEPPVSGGTMDDPAQRRVGAEEGVKTYIFTCAQNNTDLIPERHWNTLLQAVDFYDAELHVARFTYNKAAYGKKSVKPGSKKGTDEQDVWYADEIAQYISDEDVQIAPDLVWLGSLNLIPTLVNPITGFQTHTRQASCIIPHTKMAMESVPTMKHEPAKFVYTTGCVTQRNYIQKSAGQKADFHHVFGALLVEVDENGDWWARQLNFDQEGTLYDLQRCFGEIGVIEPVRAAAITHGDIHGHKMDAAVIESVFEPNGMLDVLAPREQFFHDIIDFMPRNHHNRKDFQFLREMHVQGTTSVMGEFALVSSFLMTTAYRSWCKSFVVVSNHDQAIDSWLADRTQLDDPVNLQDWLELNLRKAQNPKFHPFKHCIDMCCHAARVHAPGAVPDNKLLPRVIVEDASYKILGKIEAGLHGHLGPNGARGNPRNLRTAGKANTAHTHSAGIVEGVYTAGVLGNLDMGYNKGLSSWSHSSIVTYPNGKRAILTHRAGKWWR